MRCNKYPHRIVLLSKEDRLKKIPVIISELINPYPMNIHDLLYDNASGLRAGKGSLLIADPMMRERYFSRSVVLVLDETDDGGHLGLALNKSTHLTLRDLMPEWERGGDVTVFCGGPVGLERLFLLHSLGRMLPGSLEIVPGIYVGGDIDGIVDYVNAGGEVEGRLRFFLGYSGWTCGQLQKETDAHSWAVNPDAGGLSLLREEGDAYWRREVGRLGDNFRSWLMVPPDPSYN